MPFVSKKASNGQELKILIDTGTSKNFIKPFNFFQFYFLKTPFFVRSINGKSLITKYCKINIFGKTSIFYLLPQLSTFEGIIGYDLLKEIKANFDFSKNILYHENGTEILRHLTHSSSSSLILETSSVPLSVEPQFKKIIFENRDAFADASRALPYNTQIEATINTSTQQPIYSKSYPYPMSATDFINSEIASLLKDGIIRPSDSPYNSPIHVVTKKGIDERGNQKLRMVIDFRKLNEQTTPDRYPIPDPSAILANMGNSKFFTTLDLKSGFHQIVLAESDRKKTSFSVNNGKYEFCRLPFGLKNAPSIFQRAIDDILREFIGKFCHVYIDDVIIYSSDERTHLSHIEKVIKKLKNAGMRISPEKSKFFKVEVEYLGFIVSREGIKTCPDKVKSILEYQKPQSLRSLRSFLGLSGYYRRFIKDYAAISKPLTKYLRGDNGKVGKGKSKNINIEFDDEALKAFEKLKSILASEDVILKHPDYTQPFELTTDASGVAIGAVLSQGGRPLTMISRTLSQNEETFATNERELLAIVWALNSLRQYLYGVKQLKIFTDHQPLIYSISDKNANKKLKRWRNQIEEYAPTFHYKPGKENVVADALSRQFINQIDSDSIAAQNSDSDTATAHSEQSLSYTVKTIKYPVNQFKNQIVIIRSQTDSCSTVSLFESFRRHAINFNSIGYLFRSLKDVIDANVTNGICSDLSVLGEIQNRLISSFPGVKFVHTEKIAIDIPNPDDQVEICATEHNRAHRSEQENFHQISQEYFFPKIRSILKEIISNCKICKENKYQRKPPKPKICKTPIPQYPGEILHIDIFTTDKQHFFTTLDKFSKFAITIPINSRATTDIKSALIQVLSTFQNTKTIVSDNEKAFKSEAIKTFLRDHFGIQQFFVPTLHSESNGQVERFHSTLIEIARCTQRQDQIQNTIELILLSTLKYNNSYHSVIKNKPIEVLHGCSTEESELIKSRISLAQNQMMKTFNKNASTRVYLPGQKVFLRKNKRIGNKFQRIFIEKTIERDLGSTVLIDGIKIHKSNLR